LAFDTDHWPMLRQPQAFNQALLQWLDQQPD
jgi:pimeloyl-ACP methyl ester carboxylesterase